MSAPANKKPKFSATNIGELFAIHILGGYGLVRETGLVAKSLESKAAAVVILSRMEKLCPVLVLGKTDEDFLGFIKSFGGEIMRGLELAKNGIDDEQDKDWQEQLKVVEAQIATLHSLSTCLSFCIHELRKDPSLLASLSEQSINIFAEMGAMSRISQKLDIISVPFNEIKAAMVDDVYQTTKKEMESLLKNVPTTNPQ